MSVYDYKTAEKLLEGNKRFKRRRLANNTYLERSSMNDDKILLTFHKTVILTYYKDGLILFYTGDWPSKTTRERMNEFQRKINICSYKKKWWYCIGMEWDAKYPFYDGLIIRPNGNIREFKSEIDDQVESENFGHLMKR